MRRPWGETMKRLAVTLVLALICCVLAGCGTAVPDVRAKSLGDARAAIEAAGFKVGEVTYDPESKAATWTVITQEPNSGALAKSGSAVALTLAGRPPVKTPKLTGLDATQAAAALSAVGLQLGATSESYDATTQAGAVVGQTPAEGVDAETGSVVAVVLSRGPQPVAIPAVVGKAQADATSLLQAAGFVVTVTTRSDKAAKGTVVAMTPPGGEAQPGSSVALVVSTGLDLVKVPSWKNFRGTYTGSDWNKVLASLEAAIKAGFKKAGLTATVEFVNGIEDPKGSQSPKAGTMVPRGTKVRCKVPVVD